MLYLTTVLALTSAVITAPPAPAMPSPATVSSGTFAAATLRPSAPTNVPADAPKRPLVEFPWTRYITVQQQNAAMQAELDRFFNVDRSP